MKLQGIIEEIRESVFPSNIYCISCGRMIDRTMVYSLCQDCIRKIHWIETGDKENIVKTCAKCGKALQPEYRGDLCYDCMEIEHSFARGFSCMTYGLLEREIMMDIKYNSKGYVALKMGDVMFDRMRELIEEGYYRGFCAFDIVTAVPIGKSRNRERGYNQSQLMARGFMRRWRELAEDLSHEFGKKLPLPLYEEDLLLRTRETAMLRSLNPAERRLALKGAFEVKSHGRDMIEGKSILLIDDIYTTGATLDQCSQVLLENGAAEVYVLTLCSGGNRKPEEVLPAYDPGL